MAQVELQDQMQVCLHGHKITGSAIRCPEDRRDYCPKCGAKTIMCCLKCNAPIPGKVHYYNFSYADKAAPPAHCHSCGTAFPWHKPDAEAEAKELVDATQRVTAILRRFHLVVKQLRKRRDGRQTLDVSDEYDVQDLLHALLCQEFDDIRAEEPVPSAAGAASRIDFLLKRQKIAVEAKMTRAGLGSKQAGEQILVDVGRYKTHPDCETLICFIYDPEGWLANPAGLVSDLESHSSAKLKVIVIVGG